MPSKSAKQAHLMAAVAHNAAFAKKVGIPQSVGKDFNAADKGKKFRMGGVASPITHHGKLALPNFSGASMKHKKGGRKISRAGLAALAAQMGPPPGPPPGAGGPPMMPPGGGGPPPGMGGPPGMKRGGSVKRCATGGGIESRGKTRGTVIRMSSGGSVRGGGCETKGKTKGRFI